MPSGGLILSGSILLMCEFVSLLVFAKLEDAVAGENLIWIKPLLHELG